MPLLTMPDVTLTWNEPNVRTYRTGIDMGALYVFDAATATYGDAVAWNGLTSVELTPGGSEPTKYYANNVHYATLLSMPTLDVKIEAYVYPTEFNACLGIMSPDDGAWLDGQYRKHFGIAYRERVHSAADRQHGERITCVWGLLTKDTEETADTVNESEELDTLSWEATATAHPVSGLAGNYEPVAKMTFESADMTDQAHWTFLIQKLFGDGTVAGTLPLPETLVTDLLAVVPV